MSWEKIQALYRATWSPRWRSWASHFVIAFAAARYMDPKCVSAIYGIREFDQILSGGLGDPLDHVMDLFAAVAGALCGWMTR